MSTVHTELPALIRPPIDVMRWGAVFAGLAVGVAVHLLLTLLGAAAGFSALDAGASGDAGAMTLAAGTWNAISMLASAFFGGYVAARTSGLGRASEGVLYGVVCWGATTLLFAALASTALGTLGGGLFGRLQGAAATRVERLVPGAASRELSSPSLPDSDLVPGQHWQHYQVIRARQDAIADIQHRLSLSRERAARIVDAAASNATWWLFAATLGSLLVAMAGGALGARGKRKRHPRRALADAAVV